METESDIIDAITHAEIVQSLSEKLKAYYIFPDVAEQICLRLQERLEGGEYTDITQGELLASVLTRHIREVNQDKHLIVRWYPELLPACEGAMQHNQEWLDAWHQRAELDNFGLHKAERLPGNVGYLDIREFYDPSWGGDTAVAAMSFLANTNVLIVDLRKCRGGDAAMVALISSYIFGGRRIHLNSFYWREQDIIEQSWTLPYIPGKHFGEKPVYVLTSKDTFSGAEEFAYNLKTRQRAIVVGETTGGGAHCGSLYRVHSHFNAFIPSGYPTNPITKTNWEGSGVTPDLSIPQEQAFKVAYSLALKSIIGNLGESPSEPFRNFLEEAQTALNGLETG